MKSLLTLFAVCLLLTVASCKKEPEYTRGLVLVGVRDTVSLESVFSLMDTLNLSIEEASGFYYVSPLPEDSVGYLTTLLNAKIYINTNQLQAHCEYYPSEQGVVIIANFFNMTRTNQQDWLQTYQQLKLRPWTKAIYKALVLKVPEGSEKEWVKKLKGHPMFRWVALNEILQFGR